MLGLIAFSFVLILLFVLVLRAVCVDSLVVRVGVWGMFVVRCFGCGFGLLFIGVWVVGCELWFDSCGFGLWGVC